VNLSAREPLGPAIDGPRRRWAIGGEGLGQVCCYVAERRHGRPLVLIHDLRTASSSYEVRPLFECFRWRRPTYAVDLPGFGLSDRGALPYAPAFFAAVLSELLRRLKRGDATADVVALGRGGEVAARVARDEPALLRSLVLVEPSGLSTRRGVAPEWCGARIARGLGDCASRGIFALLTTRAVLRRTLGARFFGPPDEGLLAYAHESARVPGAHRAPLRALAAGPHGREAALLYRAIELPALVVHDACGEDAVEIEAFLRGRANRFAVRITPTRGMPHFERRVETVAALDRFWQSLPRAAWEQAMR
jgi:pimeloyl-ACP methyl ester carboxylesterase